MQPKISRQNRAETFIHSCSALFFNLHQLECKLMPQKQCWDYISSIWTIDMWRHGNIVHHLYSVWASSGPAGVQHSEACHMQQLGLGGHHGARVLVGTTVSDLQCLFFHQPCFSAGDHCAPCFLKKWLCNHTLSSMIICEALQQAQYLPHWHCHALIQPVRTLPVTNQRDACQLYACRM